VHKDNFASTQIPNIFNITVVLSDSHKGAIKFEEILETLTLVRRLAYCHELRQGTKTQREGYESILWWRNS
jgi:hypothetical protein